MQSIKTAIYQTAQIREFERLAQEKFGISGFTMMQRASHAALEFLLRRFPQAQKINVFCGGGNNGGDGYLLAHLLHERGLKVAIWQVGNQEYKKEEVKKAYEICVAAQVPIHSFYEKADLGRPDLIVDAICGIGVNQALREDIISIVERLNSIQIPIFAIDIPTGLQADTGKILGSAIRATATMTFIGLKLGLLTGEGIAYTGELALNNLQLPAELLSGMEPIAEKIHLSTYASYLKPRSRDWHKGLSGHVLIIGGDVGYSGAPRMAAVAALRVGAGLVTVATHPENAAMTNINCPEIMARGIETEKALEPLLSRANVIVIGPGLGQSDWSRKLWEYTATKHLPMVVDADGLNLLAQTHIYNDNWVLTPHPGEAGRLIGETSHSVQQDRLSTAKAIASEYGGVCVLKGAGTITFAQNYLPALCDKGNPGMASAGMGDVLSGVIGGLLSQGLSLYDAAKLGVYLHAAAGDLAAKEGERGLIATDLMPFLRRLSNYSNHV